MPAMKGPLASLFGPWRSGRAHDSRSGKRETKGSSTGSIDMRRMAICVGRLDWQVCRLKHYPVSQAPSKSWFCLPLPHNIWMTGGIWRPSRSCPASTNGGLLRRFFPQCHIMAGRSSRCRPDGVRSSQGEIKPGWYQAGLVQAVGRAAHGPSSPAKKKPR